MGRPPASSQNGWTLEEGARDVLRFLVRRSPWATGLWLACASLLTFIANLGATAGPVSIFMIMLGFITIPAGAAVGMTLSKGLVEAVHFCGCVPTLMASGAAAFVIVLGALLLNLAIPHKEPFFGVLIAVMALIGALAAVFKFTWAEA